MTKTLVAAALLMPLIAAAEILPERMGDFDRTSLTAVEVTDQALYDEFGFEEGEVGVYQTANGREARITATRFYDDTGAYSAFLWNRPAEGTDDTYGERAWVSEKGTLIHFGNYIVEIEGDLPDDDHIELMLGQYLPKIRPTPDPPVLAYVPTQGIRNGSQKYVLGPVGLEQVAPEIPPSTAGFHFGVEAHVADYDGERMLIFSYPTPEMAREQVIAFRDLNGVLAKRSGPLIAVVPVPGDPDTAQQVLAHVRYEADVTLNYEEPSRHDNLGALFLDVVILSGILAVLSIVGGIFVAGGRILASRVAPNSLFAAPEGDGLTHLGLDESLKHLNSKR